jgi:hypothetical protein
MFIQLPTTQGKNITVNVMSIQNFCPIRPNDGNRLDRTEITYDRSSYSIIELPYDEVHQLVTQAAERWAAMVAGGGASRPL